MKTKAWYHNWILHSDVTILELTLEEAADHTSGHDWDGPFPTFAAAKNDAIEKCRWEISQARMQIQQIRKIKKPS